MSDSLQLSGLQHARLLCPPLSPCLLNLWWYLTVSSSVAPSPFAFNLSQHQSFPLSRLFTSGGQSTGASASASVLPMNIQGWFPLGFLVWSPCRPRNFQESSPAPQFESINSSVLNLLYGPTLTSIHDMSRWCHPTILSSLLPFSFRIQSFSASGSFPMSQFFTSGVQSIGASASASATVLPGNIQGWFPLGMTGLISLQSKGLSRVFCNTTIQKHPFLGAQPSLWYNSHICTWLLEKA